MLTHFSLFTGIGGIDLAAEWAGFTTVGQCEYADYPTKVLEKHWPDVQRWRDIRDVTAESVRARGIGEITIISGGFPCQPFSVAGKQRGKEDDRYLWPEMCRVISELRPAWVLGENVPGIINLALDQCISDLEGIGYACQTFNIPACAVDAKHRRARIFIVAHSNRFGRSSRGDNQQGRYIQNDIQRDYTKGESEWDGWLNRIREAGSDVGDSKCEYARRNNAGASEGVRLEMERNIMENPRRSKEEHFVNTSSNDVSDSLCELPHRSWETWSGGAEPSNGDRWPTEPDVGRVANGIPSRVDRLRCLGNAVVPLQVYPILAAIAEIERKCVKSIQ
ncbi:MAG TPA: DNA (cytosine-5-)-methyltransferase [Clostridiales bacterium]|nr:DNA (cytosine-5-)-methyltransferase [Clostridiales bacterium]